MKKAEKIILITFSILLLATIILLVVYYNIFNRGGYGDEYKRIWKCDDYNFSIISRAEHFPDVPWCENVVIDGTDYDLEFNGEDFIIGNVEYFEKDGNEYCKMIPVLEGEYNKGLFSFTLNIDDVENSKYDYLEDKTLVFHKE